MFLQIHILIIPRFPYVEKGERIYFVYLTIIYKIVKCWQLIYPQIYPIMIATEETLLRQLPRYSIAKEYRARVFRLGISLFPFLFIARASLSPVCRNMPSHAAIRTYFMTENACFRFDTGISSMSVLSLSSEDMHCFGITACLKPIRSASRMRCEA